ncbi:hypothetical protein LCGC14_1078610 [marine sediment metagenome]|uniref:Uncharacterized protein n=1 Tax=marine sediment metagenome TaxID=412755 RepID=A0A0F9PZ81_9ZZZZ
MGSFNVACSISNVSIGAGDPVAYIPLEKARYRYHIGDGNDMLIYTHCFYAPVTLPIFGEYDDYGRVENIEKNRNTEIIEEFFGIPIDKVISIKEKGPAVGTISSGMFVHRKIYDIMVKKCSIANEWGGISCPIFAEPRDNPMLALTNELERYLKEVEKNIKMFDDCYRILGRDKEHDRGNHFLSSISSIFVFRDYEVFNDIYQPKMRQGELKDEIIEFVLFECGMGATNNFYFPAMNGYQCGNLYASKILYWESLKIIIKDILHRKYDWLKPKELKWTIKYRAKRYWKKLWQR